LEPATFPGSDPALEAGFPLRGLRAAPPPRASAAAFRRRPRPAPGEGREEEEEGCGAREQHGEEALDALERERERARERKRERKREGGSEGLDEEKLFLVGAFASRLLALTVLKFALPRKPSRFGRLIREGKTYNVILTSTCGIAPRPSKWGRRKWSAWGEGPPKRTAYMSRVAVSNLTKYQIVQDRKMQP
jgi:hypothetical protein